MENGKPGKQGPVAFAEQSGRADWSSGCLRLVQTELSTSYVHADSDYRPVHNR